MVQPVVEFRRYELSTVRLMRRHVFCTRFVATIVVVAMIWPALAVTVEAATATWLAPQPGDRITSRNVEVSVGYNTQSDLEVTRLELWIDGRYYATRSLIRPEPRGVCSFWWDTAKFAPGAHQLTVRIYAGDKLVASVSSNAVIGQKSYDLRVPNVRFANIKSGDVLKGTVTIKMVVTDDSAEPPIVSLLVDGALKYLTNRQPYVCSLDTTKYPDGQHELQTYAYDSAGNKSDPVSVKVVFQNNIERPRVASIETEPGEGSVAPSEDDGVGQLLPPSIEPKTRTEGVARAAEAEPLPSITNTPAAKPAARESRFASSTQPTMRPAVPALKKAEPTIGEKVVALRPDHKLESPRPIPEPAVSLQTDRQDTSTVPSIRTAATDLERKPHLVPVEPQSSADKAHPTVSKTRTISPPAVSAPRVHGITAAAATRVSESKSTVRVRAAAPAESNGKLVKSVPVVTKDAVLAEPERAIVGVERKMRSDNQYPLYSNERLREALPMEDRAMSMPAVNQQPIVAVERHVDESSVHRVAYKAPRTPRSPADECKASMPQPVRVALLPTMRSSEKDNSVAPHLSRTGIQLVDRNAKLEKRVFSKKGAIKLRDLVDSLGGVVFWEPATRTAVAYIGSIKLEVIIGKPVVRVNGRLMRTSTVPKIVNGRTIIEAGLYYQACAFAEQLAAAVKE